MAKRCEIEDPEWERIKHLHVYKEQHLVECFSNKMKQFRHVATRYDKLVGSFIHNICLYFIYNCIIEMSFHIRPSVHISSTIFKK